MSASVRAFSDDLQHILVDGYLSKIQNQIHISMQSTEIPLKSSEFCYCRPKSSDQINSACNICFCFFLLLFNTLVMMATDSWKHLLFTSHSRTNYQLQDKRLNITNIISYSRNKKQLKRIKCSDANLSLGLDLQVQKHFSGTVTSHQGR